MGSKRTVFENFTEVAKVLNRENEHLRLFCSVELGTECHLAPVSRLIIDGKFVSRQLEALIRKYATDFVESPSLKGSFDTVLTR
jgi:translation initiation factor 2 beta subunit (eIF-2beta)/eIF-5